MCCNDAPQPRQPQPTKKLKNRYQEVQKQQRSSLYQQERQKQNQQILSLKQSQAKLMEQIAIANKNNRLLCEKEQNFRKNFEFELIDNNKKMKGVIVKLNEAKTVNQLQVQMDRLKYQQIGFKSIEVFFSPQQQSLNRSDQNRSNMVIQQLSQIYHLYLSSEFTHKKLVFTVTFYLEFVTEIIGKGYSQSNDVKLKNHRIIMKQIANSLFDQFQKLINLAKNKFTKERSKILEEGSIDSSHEEMKLRTKIDQLQERIQILLAAKERYQGENNVLISNTIPSLKEQLNRKQLKEINEIKGTLVEVQNSIVSKQEFEVLFKKFYSNEQSSEIIREKDEKIQMLSAKLANMQKQKSMLSEQTDSENKRQLIKELQAKDAQIKKMRQEFSTKIEEKNSQIIRLSLQNKQYEKQIAQLSAQLIKQKQSLKQQSNDKPQRQQSEQLLKDIKRLEKQVQDLKLNSIELELSASKAQNQKFQLQDQIKELKNELKNKEKVNIQLEKQITYLKQQKKVELKQDTLLQKQKIQLQNNLKALQLELNDQKKLAQYLQKKLDQIPKEQSRVRSVSFVKHHILFNGTILQSRKVQKKFLMDSIEKHMGLQIEKTQKLYDYKRDNATNFHKFVNGHSNIVLIVQTEKALIAGYYSGIYQNQIPMVQEGLLLSLDSRKYYKLNNFRNYPNKDQRDQRTIRGMVYDDYYIIFGNAEVRIRTGEHVVFSNFGISNSYFNSERDKVSHLLKDGSNNEVQFINYQIHQVHFDQEHYLESLQ